MEQKVTGRTPFFMKQGFITISEDEFVRLKKKEKIADDALVQLRMSLDDIRAGRVSKF